MAPPNPPCFRGNTSTGGHCPASDLVNISFYPIRYQDHLSSHEI
jgi:hypothetical protein